MVDVTPMIKSNSKVIQSYGDYQFKISGKMYSGPILVSPEKVSPWQLEQDFNAEHPGMGDFSQLMAAKAKIDVLLYGAGDKSVFIPPDFKAILKNQGLPIEAMTTAAACRTYNVLLSEGRRVVAALLPVAEGEEK